MIVVTLWSVVILSYLSSKWKRPDRRFVCTFYCYFRNILWIEILSHEFKIKVSVKYNHRYCVAYIALTSNNVAKLLSCCAYFNWNFYLFNPSSTSKDVLHNISLIQIICIHPMDPFGIKSSLYYERPPWTIIIYFYTIVVKQTEKGAWNIHPKGQIFHGH